MVIAETLVSVLGTFILPISNPDVQFTPVTLASNKMFAVKSYFVL